MKLDRVVVGVDFSPPSMETARWAVRHFASGAELVLAHVISMPEPPPIVSSRFPRRDLLIDTLKEGADKRLRDLTLSLAAQRVVLEIREGQPAETLARIAEDWSADLVVTGTHGERPGEWEGLGSTAQSLVRISGVPVLLVARTYPATPSSILVPVDDSDMAAEALGWAGELSRKFGAKVTVLHVVAAAVSSAALAAASMLSGSPPLVPGSASRTTPESDRWIERAVSAGVPSERARSEVTFGEPTREILGAADRLGADLVVMGRRGSGRIRRALLGSVVDGVLRGAKCPVLVIVEPAAPLG